MYYCACKPLGPRAVKETKIKKEQFWSFMEIYNNVLWRNQVKLNVCFVSRCGEGGDRENSTQGQSSSNII